MGPLPNDRQKVNKPVWSVQDADEENYEEDDWQVGYEVMLNGVGIQQLVQDEPGSDSESDGYEGPGDGSDGEDDFRRRAGYQQLPMESEEQPHSEVDGEETSENTDECEEKGDDDDDVFKKLQECAELATEPAVGTIHYSIQREFEEALKTANSVHLKDADFAVHANVPKRDVELSPEKISEIKSAVSNISLPSPEWAADVDDEQLKEMLRSLKSPR